MTFKIIDFNQVHIITPLHYAVKNEYVEFIKLLLENKKINIDTVDDKGKRPIDYTTNNDIKQLLNH